ncbi:C-type lectin domain family 4 member E-like isoform X2 [Sparus aurata]|uniref:C-type lectin domain family 4 member E-like isoform X2 n=1 Tax=Sparus aurata TaxID=8175 RepID=UPI0011C1B034|nr:C-type lectin domain family 4 member E-like isoform X2 [Sparus aurata]
MAEADAVYVNARFMKSNGNAKVIETTNSEVDTLNSEPSAELPGSQQQAAGESKVTAERVAVVVLLAAAVIALSYTGYKYHQTTKHLQKLTDENAAMRKNITADTCHKCQEGWEQNGPQCYYFSTDELTWEQARERCRRDGADLVKIESEDEQSFLIQKVKDKMVEDEDKFWIGLTDSVTEGTWLWTDGSPLNKSLTFWARGQPDNWKGENADGEDCVRMAEISRLGLKGWFDKSCTAPQKRICEKSAETGR